MTKTDNQNLQVKVDLRLEYLNRYGGTSCIDCCQGSGAIWKQIRPLFPDVRYFGIDQKRKSGRHSCDSSRILALKDQTWDVVDIDTYGCPFSHYLNLCKSMTVDTTVFLTYGHGLGAGPATSSAVRNIIGIPKKTPQSLAYMAQSKYINIVLYSCICYDIIPSDITHIKQSDTVDYYALRLQKKGLV